MCVDCATRSPGAVSDVNEPLDPRAVAWPSCPVADRSSRVPVSSMGSCVGAATTPRSAGARPRGGNELGPGWFRPAALRVTPTWRARRTATRSRIPLTASNRAAAPSRGLRAEHVPRSTQAGDAASPPSPRARAVFTAPPSRKGSEKAEARNPGHDPTAVLVLAPSKIPLRPARLSQAGEPARSRGAPPRRIQHETVRSAPLASATLP